MRVFVYYNLHKQCLSVRAMQGPERGRVVAHCAQVILGDVTFKVSEAGRQRVLLERAKNVHAGVVGDWINDQDEGQMLVTRRAGTAITYDPYKWPSFVERGSESPVFTAEMAFIDDKRVTAWGTCGTPEAIH